MLLFKNKTQLAMIQDAEMIGFGGGCHWCTEAVFQSLKGVAQVEQGFIRSDVPADTWSEAVIVHYDPVVIDLTILMEVHLRTHAATKHHSMRSKYRSAIYTFDGKQAEVANLHLGSLQEEFGEPLVTEVLPFRAFKASDERFHDYYRTDPERPFCKTYIDPKLDLIRREFASQVSA